MSRKSSQNSISLFPFLAVLVCTMGALILLLLVTTRQIQKDRTESVDAITEADPVTAEVTDGLDESLHGLPDFQQVEELTIPSAVQPSPFDVAIAEERSERESEIDQLKADVQSETFRLHELQNVIADVRRQLEEGESDSEASVERLAELKQQESQLRQDLLAQQQQIAQLTTELDEKSARTEQAETILRTRESALVSLRKIVQEAEGAAGTDGTVLEFTNTTGTQRAPIVIDVRGEEFVFSGTNVSLTEADLDGFPGNDNPLLAGIFALHEARFPDTVVSQPYVLLLVRPSGTMMFYAAQRSLSQASVHFGYELLEEDRTISTPTIPPEELIALRTAITEALQRRTRLYRGPRHDSERSPDDGGMRVTPDGRVVLPGETPESETGRFYAGGRPLPNEHQASPPSDRRRDWEERGRAESETPESETAAAQPTTRPAMPEIPNQQQWDELLDQRADDLAAESGLNGSGSEASAFDQWAAGSNLGTSEAAASGDDAMNSGTFSAEVGDGTVFPKIHPQPSEETSAAASDSGESLFASAFPELSEIDDRELESLTPADILGRPAALSGNLGIRGGGDIGVAPHATAAESYEPTVGPGGQCGENLVPFEFPESAQQPSEPAPAHPTPDSPSERPGVPYDSELPSPETPYDLPVPPRGVPAVPQERRAPESAQDRANFDQPSPGGEEDSDRTDSLERFDWPDTATADAAQETRPVESPENPVTSESAALPREANARPNTRPKHPAAPSNPRAGSAPHRGGQNVDDMSAANNSFLQQFMQTQQPVIPEPIRPPNPALKELMATARADDPQNVGYHPVQIRIEKTGIVVGDQSAFEIAGLSPNAILKRTLEGLAAEVSALPDAGESELTPTVNYVVGEGAGPIQRRLASTLIRMDVPTRTIVNVRPDGSNAARSSHASDESGESAAGSSAASSHQWPAEPVDDGLSGSAPARTTDVPEPRSQGRRLSL